MQTEHYPVMQVRYVPPSGGRPGVALHDSSRYQVAVALWSIDGPTAPPRTVRLSTPKQATTDSDVQSWVHLAMLGTWKGHRAGVFSFDPVVFGELIKNFDALKNLTPWTIGHPDGSTPAPGWVQQLAIVGDGTDPHDGIYALTRWTAETAAEIKRGGWKYCSVFVDFESLDRATNEPIGCELIQVGLTNNPFLDGQKPIECSRFSPAEIKTMTATKLKKPTPADLAQEQLDGIAKMLGMSGETPEKIKSTVDALVALIAHYTAAAPAADAPPADAAAMCALPADKFAVWSKRLVTLSKALKLDGPSEMPPGAAPATAGDDDEAAEGALLDKLLAILAKAGITDVTAQAAALDANADAIASLLTGGGTPVAADATMPPAAMSRLKAAALREKEDGAQIVALAAKVKTFEDAAAATKLAADEAEKNAAAVKLEAEKAARVTEVDAIVAECVKTGKLRLAVKRTEAGALTKVMEGSEAEVYRGLLLSDFEGTKKALALKMGVPLDPITSAAAPHPVPPAPKAEADEISLAQKDLRDEVEIRLVAQNRGKPRDFVRNAIALHRQAVADHAAS